MQENRAKQFGTRSVPLYNDLTSKWKKNWSVIPEQVRSELQCSRAKFLNATPIRRKNSAR